MALCSIRPYQADDAEGLWEAARESVGEVFRWLSWCHAQYSMADAVEWVRSRAPLAAEGREYSFAILGSGGRFLGGCGLNQINRIHRFANLGYWVRTSATRQGVATEAVRQVAAFAFANTDLVRLEIVCAVRNDPSQRVAERAGAVREGVLRHRLLLHGQPVDAVMYSLVRGAHQDLVEGNEVAARLARDIVAPKEALAFVERHGIVLQAARGPVPSLAEAIAGGPIRGSWWGHPKGKEIYHAAEAISESPDVLVCKLIGGKITYVHRRLWPALVKVAARFRKEQLAKVWDEHTSTGAHRSRREPFPAWVPADAMREAAAMSLAEAERILSAWPALDTPTRVRSRQSRRSRG